MYILTKNGNQLDKWPYSFQHLKNDNPDISYPATVTDDWLAVAGIIRVEDVARPDDTYEVSYIEADPVLSNGKWMQTWAAVPKPTPSIEDLITHAKDTRYKFESRGVYIGGILVASDRESQVKIMGARMAADTKTDWFTVWEAADGESHTIDAPTMRIISDMVEDHVNKAFVVYAGVKSDIDNGLVTSFQEIDDVFMVAFEE
jgi:hypothetical protein